MQKALEPTAEKWDGSNFIVISGDNDMEVLKAVRLHHHVATYANTLPGQSPWVAAVIAAKASTVLGLARDIRSDYDVAAEIHVRIDEAERAAADLCGFTQGKDL